MDTIFARYAGLADIIVSMAASSDEDLLEMFHSVTCDPAARRFTAGEVRKAAWATMKGAAQWGVPTYEHNSSQHSAPRMNRADVRNEAHAVASHLRWANAQRRRQDYYERREREHFERAERERERYDRSRRPSATTQDMVALFAAVLASVIASVATTTTLPQSGCLHDLFRDAACIARKIGKHGMLTRVPVDRRGIRKWLMDLIVHVHPDKNRSSAHDWTALTQRVNSVVQCVDAQ